MFFCAHPGPGLSLGLTKCLQLWRSRKNCPDTTPVTRIEQDLGESCSFLLWLLWAQVSTFLRIHLKCRGPGWLPVRPYPHQSEELNTFRAIPLCPLLPLSPNAVSPTPSPENTRWSEGQGGCLQVEEEHVWSFRNQWPSMMWLWTSTQEEWGQLDLVQRTLYRDVMLRPMGTLLS